MSHVNTVHTPTSIYTGAKNSSFQLCLSCKFLPYYGKNEKHSIFIPTSTTAYFGEKLSYPIPLQSLESSDIFKNLVCHSKNKWFMSNCQSLAVNYFWSQPIFFPFPILIGNISSFENHLLSVSNFFQKIKASWENHKQKNLNFECTKLFCAIRNLTKTGSSNFQNLGNRQWQQSNANFTQFL